MKLVYGWGINDADYITNPGYRGGSDRVKCPYYRTWFSMIERGYSLACKTKRPNYKDCTVDERWKYFSVFKSWMQDQQ